MDANPVQKATIIADRLLQYLMINNHVLYIYNDVTVSYKVVKQPTIEYLLMLSRRLIVQSYEEFDAKERRVIRGYNLLISFRTDY